MTSPTPTRPPRRLSTEIPQRRLALELRFWIDHTMQRPTDANVRQLAELIADNPRGWASEHVRHNLGERRLRWVEDTMKEVYP